MKAACPLPADVAVKAEADARPSTTNHLRYSIGLQDDDDDHLRCDFIMKLGDQRRQIATFYVPPVPSARSL